MADSCWKIIHDFISSLLKLSKCIVITASCGREPQQPFPLCNLFVTLFTLKSLIPHPTLDTILYNKSWPSLFFHSLLPFQWPRCTTNLKIKKAASLNWTQKSQHDSLLRSGLQSVDTTEMPQFLQTYIQVSHLCFVVWRSTAAREDSPTEQRGPWIPVERWPARSSSVPVAISLSPKPKSCNSLLHPSLHSAFASAEKLNAIRETNREYFTRLLSFPSNCWIFKNA